MIGNNDIFDEHDLEAIANDASSAEDSSCLHSDAPTDDLGMKEKTANGKKSDGLNKVYYLGHILISITIHISNHTHQARQARRRRRNKRYSVKC